jgi:hypothetical protein
MLFCWLFAGDRFPYRDWNSHDRLRMYWNCQTTISIFNPPAGNVNWIHPSIIYWGLEIFRSLQQACLSVGYSRVMVFHIGDWNSHDRLRIDENYQETISIFNPPAGNVNWIHPSIIYWGLEIFQSLQQVCFSVGYSSVIVFHIGDWNSRDRLRMY